MKKLFAMLLALTMTFQLITPAWADAVEAPVETTEETEIVEEQEEESEEDIPEELEAVPEEIVAEEPAESQTCRITFHCTPEDLTLVVYPKDADIDQAIEPEEDGSYLLKAGEYAYLAAAEGYEAAEGTFAAEADAQVEVTLEELSEADDPNLLSDLPDIHLPTGTCIGCGWPFEQCYRVTDGRINWRPYLNYNDHPGTHAWWCFMNARETSWELHDTDGAGGACSICGHVHELTAVLAKAPTETEKGNNAYYTCPRCRGVYKDAEATQVTTVEQEMLPSLSDNKCGPNLTWTIGEDGTLTISGSGAMNNYTYKSMAPWHGYRDRITALVVEDGVTGIGSYALYQCAKLTSVTLSESVTDIGSYAFSDCSDLETAIIPDGMIRINANVFRGCASLISVTIPQSVKTIEYWAFEDCASLKDVYYGGTKEQWQEISVDGSHTELENAVVHYALGDVHTLNAIPEEAATCIQAGNSAYYQCTYCKKLFLDAEGKQETSRENVTLPALGHDMTKTEAVAPTYTAPGNNEYYTCTRCGKVFKDADGKTETTVEAETLERLPSIAYGTCGENVNWVLTEDGTLTISGTGAMQNYSSSSTAPWYKNRKDILNAVVKSGVTSLSSYAFYGCYKLASATLEEGVQSVGSYAFSDCKKLTSVTLSDGLKSIYDCAFSGCSGLTSVTIPEGVTSIEDYTFSGCSSLTSVYIPKTVQTIGYMAFYYCDMLKDVYYSGTDIEWPQITIEIGRASCRERV